MVESSLTPLTPALSRATIDMAGFRRTDDEWLDRAWRAPGTRVLVLERGEPQTYGWRALLAKQSRARVAGDPGKPKLVYVSPQETPPGERYLLGVADDGQAYFAVRAEAGFELAEDEDARVLSLREVGALLDAADSGLLTHAVALANWHATYGFCPRCGAATRVAAAGHVRVCDFDVTEHYPRMDPAVIMLVHGGFDGEEKCLLARNRQWPGHRYSVLAGFVEPGESLEQAVIREVAEEVGVVVADPRYLGSQPWPFPRSLMLGYHARAVGETERTDYTEIDQVRWFSRSELGAAAEAEEVLLPGRLSIARPLIENWYGGSLPGSW